MPGHGTVCTCLCPAAQAARTPAARMRMQNPTEDVIESKLRVLGLANEQRISFAHLCHVW